MISTWEGSLTPRHARPIYECGHLILACVLAGCLSLIPFASRAQDAPSSAPSSSPNVASQQSVVTATAPSFHLSFGGEGLPGGTYALGRHTGAYQYSYEQPDVVGDFGLQIGYLNQGHLTQFKYFYDPVDVPLRYRDAYFIELDRWSPTFFHCRVGAAAGPQV
jgi:hypothetical protein